LLAAETATWLSTIIIIAVLIGVISIGQRANRADWGGFFSNTIDGWVRLFCRYYHRFEYEPIPLPEQGGAIIVSNHISGLDPMLIIAACNRPVHFMIAREQYLRFGLNWLFRLAGCIPVDRSSRRNDVAFRSALRALSEGKVVALFPQGQIHHGKEPPPRLKRGVYRLSQLSGAQVYPLHVSGVKGIGYVMRGVILRAHARLESCPPVNCAVMTDQECLAVLAKGIRATHH